jgi:hypothetical protein
VKRARGFPGAAAIAIAAALALSAQAARAQDLSFDLPVFGRTTFSMTSTTTLRYRGQNYDFNRHDDEFGSLAQRFDLALQGDELRAELRIDAFVPTTVFTDLHPPCPEREANQCYLAWDLRPERMTLRWEHDDWNIEIGDSQLVLGRGMALAFRKVDLLGVDTALRGAHVRYQGENVRVRLHAGLANPQNQDPIDLRVIRELEDVVIAGAAGITIPGSTRIDVGVHAARVWFQDDVDIPFEHRTVDVAGWSIEAPALADGRLALYAEANGLRRTLTLFDEPGTETGRAVYASAQLSLDNLTVLVEWKDYRNFLMAASTSEGRAWRIYGAAPSIEYEGGPQRLRAIGNQRGGGVRVDYAFLPGPWSFSVNLVAYGLAEEQRIDPWDGILVTHGWLTLARRQEYGEDLVWSVNAVVGYRHELFLHDPMRADGVGWGDLDRRMIHGQLELTVGSGEHSFDLALDHRV